MNKKSFLHRCMVLLSMLVCCPTFIGCPTAEGEIEDDVFLPNDPVTEDLAGGETGDGQKIPERTTTPKDGREMVLIPAGAFEMDSNDPEADTD